MSRGLVQCNRNNGSQMAQQNRCGERLLIPQ
jgi:hypothetical protein